MSQGSLVTEEQLRGWIERQAGVRVSRMTRQAGGGSREAWRVDALGEDDQPRRLFVRRDLGTGPVSGSELTLAREASVHRALASTDIPVVPVVAVDEANDVVLAEFVDGSGDFADLVVSPARGAVMDDFISILGALHNLEPAALDLPRLTRPADGPAHALDDLALWTRLYEGAHTPDPIVRAAIVWLGEHRPAHVERTVLVHGDCGPGNFLFAGDHVTAVVDWEFAHFGDASDDLAWLGFRDDVSNGLAFGGRLDDALRRWSALTGLPVEQERLTYYGLLVLVRCAVCCLRGLYNAGANIDNSVWHALLPRMHRAIAHLLADIHDITPAPLPEIDVGATNETDRVLATVLRDLAGTVQPALASPDAIKRAAGMGRLVEYLVGARRQGPAVEALQLDALASILGGRPDHVGDGRRQLEEMVAVGHIAVAAAVEGLCLDADLDWALWRHTSRSAHPYPPLYRPRS